jgi:DNA integrity scanning protein DisA with diadenylate cyclase activity
MHQKFFISKSKEYGNRKIVAMTQDIRVYDVQHQLEERLSNMTEEQLLGAEEVVHHLFSYLQRVHFEEQKEVNVKAFTKTMEELQEICMQLLVEKFQRMDRMLPVKK